VSLRARLLAAVLALTATGLLIAGAVTYAEQRSFLYQRSDEQAVEAVGALGRALDDEGVGGHGPDHPGDGPDRGRPGGSVHLPPGTYGERRDASGRSLGHVVVSYGQSVPPGPRLPRQMETETAVTVPAVSGDVRYRAIAFDNRGSDGTTVIAVPLTEADETLRRLLRVEGLVIGGVLALLALVGWVVVRIGLRPLDRIGATAGAIAAGDLSRRVDPATPRTEVGRLGLALNAMLARLESAFAARQASEERLRAFIADASHELRTPLASIRGYAELFRLGAARGPDAEKAMQRIEEEAKRMGVLVEDLLTLARLDEVRDGVREDVDVVDLARDAVSDASAAAPDRSITLDAGGPAIASGDPDQLRQVLANLLRNALVHTPEGTPVEVSVGRDGEAVVLTVRDHGPGLPAGDPVALFERFWRAEAGRRRGKAGAGLGLAIVAGIVAAHGGAVSARNARGGGASFVVRIPGL
jgi:two-component system OmpR family sensor kinase